MSNSSSSAYPTDLQHRWDRLAEVRLETAQPAPMQAVRPFPSHLRFGSGGNGADYCLFGWHNPEADFTWNSGIEAVLELPAPPTAGPYLLNLFAAPFIAGDMHRQTMELSIRGELIARWSLSYPGHYFALLFDHHLAGTLDLVFRIPDTCSPKELGLNGDERRLGVRFHQLWLTPWEGVSL